MSLVLVAVLSLSSGGFLSERADAPKGVSLLGEGALAQAVSPPAVDVGQMTRVALQTEREGLLQHMPTLTGPIVLTSVGAGLVVLGALLIAVGWPLIGIGIGILIGGFGALVALAGVIMVIVGVVQLGVRGHARDEANERIEAIDAQLRTLDAAPPAAPPAPSVMMLPAARLFSLAI
jgi:hypothetical protein